ncbi:hypothetical protein V6N12_048173 [Hibiscus sabdariffa]|uniref:Uncharacterized protein n=1 Tax=Hibiscus sabdariffa TaxID=183260 RepID=A0ABR2EGH0_9ROSI
MIISNRFVQGFVIVRSNRSSVTGDPFGVQLNVSNCGGFDDVRVQIEKHRINRKNRDVDIGNKVQTSRIEALSAFIWSHSITSTKANTKHGDEDICFYAIVHAENLGRRFNLPLPDHSFGNLFRIVMPLSRSRNDSEKGQANN